MDGSRIQGLSVAWASSPHQSQPSHQGGARTAPMETILISAQYISNCHAKVTRAQSTQNTPSPHHLGCRRLATTCQGEEWSRSTWVMSVSAPAALSGDWLNEAPQQPPAHTLLQFQPPYQEHPRTFWPMLASALVVCSIEHCRTTQLTPTSPQLSYQVTLCIESLQAPWLAPSSSAATLPAPPIHTETQEACPCPSSASAKPQSIPCAEHLGIPLPCLRSSRPTRVPSAQKDVRHLALWTL